MIKKKQIKGLPLDDLVAKRFADEFYSKKQYDSLYQ